MDFLNRIPAIETSSRTSDIPGKPEADGYFDEAGPKQFTVYVVAGQKESYRFLKRLKQFDQEVKKRKEKKAPGP